MRMTASEFRRWDRKSVTLLGMSGVGKTHLSTCLRHAHWFHYSADYRIGTRYLNEPILDNIKRQAMQVPFLRELLRADSIYISNNITVDNLTAVLTFLGKLGMPSLGGLALLEFKRRQKLYRDAEVAAMLDVPAFITKAHEIYGYRHFVNDSAGSLCELDDPDVLDVLARDTLIVYIEATPEYGRELMRRAELDPKPLYYREPFLDAELAVFRKERGIARIEDIVPDEFVLWMFPRLFQARIPRYEAIARDHGYTIGADVLGSVSSEEAFVECVAGALDQG
ncbi:MAG: ATPase [Gammaproteobacteria bacterium]|nr:ATPase [Gammaproteobacteria bacterium]MBI5617059.1 ATPase [Gammaproteobacteria bacterium]